MAFISKYTEQRILKGCWVGDDTDESEAGVSTTLRNLPLSASTEEVSQPREKSQLFQMKSICFPAHRSFPGVLALYHSYLGNSWLRLW